MSGRNGREEAQAVLAELEACVSTSFCLKCGHVGAPDRWADGRTFCGAGCGYMVHDPAQQPIAKLVQRLAAALRSAVPASAGDEG